MMKWTVTDCTWYCGKIWKVAKKQTTDMQTSQASFGSIRKIQMQKKQEYRNIMDTNNFEKNLEDVTKNKKRNCKHASFRRF